MANAVFPVIAGNSAQLITGGVDTGQVRCRFQTGAIFNAFDNAMVQRLEAAREMGLVLRYVARFDANGKAREINAPDDAGAEER